jgi:hypothetical protein
MSDPDVIVAVSALASAIVALGALVVSISSVIRSTKAGKDAQAAREAASTAQWKMSEHLQVIAEVQAELAKTAISETQEPGAAGAGRKRWSVVGPTNKGRTWRTINDCERRRRGSRSSPSGRRSS